MKLKHFFAAVLFLPVLNFAENRDFYTDRSTRIDLNSIQGANPTVTMLDRPLYRFGFYATDVNATQPMNWLLPYHDCSPMTSLDSGMVFVSNFIASMPTGYSWGKVARTVCYGYITYSGTITTSLTGPFGVYYQFTKGSRRGMIYRIGTVAHKDCPWGYIVPDIDVVCYIGDNMTPGTEIRLNLVDLKYVDDPNNANFRVSIGISDQSGLNIGQLKWGSTEGHQLWLNNSINALASSTPKCRIGMQYFGWNGDNASDYLGYVDLTYNKTTHANSTANYHVFIREKYLNYSTTCSSYGTVNTSGTTIATVGCFDHIKVNPKYPNSILFTDAYAQAVPAVQQCAYQYHLPDVTKAVSPSYSVSLLDGFGTTQMGHRDQGFCTHDTWSEDGEWIYTVAESYNAGNIPIIGLNRINRAGTFCQSIFDVRNDPINTATCYPCPDNPWPNNTSCAHQANWKNSYCILDRTIGTMNVGGYFVTKLTYLDITDFANRKPSTLCEIQTQKSSNGPVHYTPHASFSHSGKFITFQYLTILPNNQQTWAVGAVSRTRCDLLYPPANMAPVLNLLLK